MIDIMISTRVLMVTILDTYGQSSEGYVVIANYQVDKKRNA